MKSLMKLVMCCEAGADPLRFWPVEMTARRGLYRMGKHPAVVTAVLGGDTYSIVYDDGGCIFCAAEQSEKPIEVMTGQV